MGIEVRRTKSGGTGFLYLRSQLNFNFIRIDAGRRCPLLVENTLLVNERRNRLTGGRRRPWVACAVACNGQMQSNIRLGMSLCESGEPGKMLTGHNRASRVDKPGRYAAGECGVNTARDTKIVSMDDKQTLVRIESKPVTQRSRSRFAWCAVDGIRSRYSTANFGQQTSVQGRNMVADSRHPVLWRTLPMVHGIDNRLRQRSGKSPDAMHCPNL